MESSRHCMCLPVTSLGWASKFGLLQKSPRSGVRLVMLTWPEQRSAIPRRQSYCSISPTKRSYITVYNFIWRKKKESRLCQQGWVLSMDSFCFVEQKKNFVIKTTNVAQSLLTSPYKDPARMDLIFPSWHSGYCTPWCHFTRSFLLQNIRTTWWFPSVLILDEKLRFQAYVLSSKRWIIYLENDLRFQLEIPPLEIFLQKGITQSHGSCGSVPHPSACLSPRTVVGWCFL